MSSEEEGEAKRIYAKAFEDLKRHGVPGILAPHQLASLYAVASICYDDGNHKPLIEDGLFDRLCKWFYDHYDECVAQGADMLDRDLLNCCSGHDTEVFVKPHHEIAEVFLGHACQCLKCRQERQEQAEVAAKVPKKKRRGPASPHRGRSDTSRKQPNRAWIPKPQARGSKQGAEKKTKPGSKRPPA